MKAACFSVASMDYFPQQNEYFAGGNSLNQAIRFKDLGLETAFIGAIGTDVAGVRIYDLFQKKEVDVSHLYRCHGITACNELVNDEQGERFGVEGAWKNGVYDSFELSANDWKYIEDFEIWSTHGNGRNYSTCLEKKHKNFLVVDFLHFDTYELLRQGAEKIDIAYFGGTINQYDDLLALSKEMNTLIILTLGKNGSIAFSKGSVFQQEALAVTKVLDTTGCGDAFQASFTASYFQNRDIQAALYEAAMAGREATQKYGGVSWNS